MEIQVDTDVFLLGAGPIGIEIAVALKQKDFAYSHIEAGCIGSTIDWYAPGTHFFSSPERIEIAGVPLVNNNQTKATREEYLTYLRGVVAQHQLIIQTYERVVQIKPAKSGFAIETVKSAHGVGGPREEHYSVSASAQRKKYSAKRIVLAIGDMHLPRKLNIPGEDLPHVSHYLESPHRYYGRRVLIVGGKNSAVEAAVRLYRAGAKVTMSYRKKELDKDRIKYWLYPEILHLIKKGCIDFLAESQVLRVTENTVEMNNTPEERSSLTQAFDDVLLLTGYEQESELFTQLGVNLHGEGKCPEFNPVTMETNVSGVYVAGTAIAGTQLGGVKEFIETSHVHVDRILASLSGEKPPESDGPAKDFLEN